MCQLEVQEDSVYLYSPIAAGQDVCSYVCDYTVDAERVLTKVKMIETLNPCAREFRALKIKLTN